MYDSQPTTTVVPNRLSSVRELLHEQLRTWLPKFCVAVSNCDDKGPGTPPVDFLRQKWMLAGIKAPFFDGIYPNLQACVFACNGLVFYKRIFGLETTSLWETTMSHLRSPLF